MTLFSHVQRVWLVGGGPSLRDFDFGRLAGRAVVAINRAAEVLPDASVVYWTDHRFWSWHQAALTAHRGRLHAARDPFGRSYPPEVVQWRLTGLAGLERIPGGLRHGNNAGYAAINLAVQLGAREIVLLGYDLRIGSDDRGHWHSGHPWPGARARTYAEKMLPWYETLVDPLWAAGVKVINATPGSALEVFPRADAGALLREG